MSIPVSKVVNVAIQASPTFPAAKGFGLLCIIGNSQSLPIGDRIRFYSRLTDVAVDFGSTTEEYKAAQVFFSQTPAPTELAIARRFDAAVPGELLGSLSCSKNLADYTAIAAGSLTLNVDGGEVALTEINLSAAANLNAVAAAVQTALSALKAGSTVTYTGTRFIVRSGTTGAASAVSAATAPAAGTDLGPIMGLTAALGAKATVGSAVETITDTLNNLQNANGSWYGLTFTKEVTEQNIKDAAAWTETQAKVFGYTTANNTVLDAASDTDIASYMKSMNYSRTIGQYDDNDSYAVVSALSRAFTVDFAGQSTTITLKFKQEPDVTPTTLTESQRLVLVGKNINYYSYFGDSAILAEGVMASGRFFDEVHGLDWLKNAIETNVFGYLYASPKVPQTDKGVARVVQKVEKACQQGVDNGLLAPGYWNGEGVGEVESGEFLPKGFYVYAAPVAQQSQADREARIAPLITVLAKGSGAIHHVDITLNFER
jgi:hypothetical protein